MRIKCGVSPGVWSMCGKCVENERRCTCKGSKNEYNKINECYKYLCECTCVRGE